MNPSSDIEQRIATLEQAVKDLETCNRGNVTALMRVKAQTSAVYSLLAEVTQRYGFPARMITEHFRVRSQYYLDRMLSEAEQQNPAIGAVLDDREVEEVPEFDGFPPLFTDEPPESDSSETGY